MAKKTPAWMQVSEETLRESFRSVDAFRRLDIKVRLRIAEVILFEVLPHVAVAAPGNSWADDPQLVQLLRNLGDELRTAQGRANKMNRKGKVRNPEQRKEIVRRRDELSQTFGQIAIEMTLSRDNVEKIYHRSKGNH